MARKNHSDEFRRQAVDLYESTPGATVRGIAEDPGDERGALRHWLGLYGTGTKTAADGTLTRSPVKPQQPAGESANRGRRRRLSSGSPGSRPGSLSRRPA